MKYPGSLHNHSEYSNLRLRDSINRVNEMVDYAIELGQNVIAITEHDTVANAVKVEKYYKKIQISKLFLAMRFICVETDLPKSPSSKEKMTTFIISY